MYTKSACSCKVLSRSAEWLREYCEFWNLQNYDITSVVLHRNNLASFKAATQADMTENSSANSNLSAAMTTTGMMLTTFSCCQSAYFLFLLYEHCRCLNECLIQNKLLLNGNNLVLYSFNFGHVIIKHNLMDLRRQRRLNITLKGYNSSQHLWTVIKCFRYNFTTLALKIFNIKKLGCRIHLTEI